MADYPISNVPRRVQYVNSGVGPYAFAFEVLTQTDIAVYRGSTLLTLTTDYTVTINANGTGSVTLVAAGTGNITIVGARAIQRSSDYTTGGDLFASTLNTDLDSQTIFSQQLAEDIDLSIKVPVYAPSSTGLTVNPEANALLGWDSTGTNLINIDAGSLASIATYATAYADVFVGDGSETEYTLSRNPGSLYNLDISVDGVTQEPVRDYTLLGTVVTFTSAMPLNSRIVIKYKEGLPNVSGDSQDIRYVPAGTGAVTTTVQAKLRETVSVKDFGAVGDGVTDDTTAIQTALNEAFNAGGGVVFVPAGTYKINKPLIVRTNTVLEGTGFASKIVQSVNFNLPGDVIHIGYGYSWNENGQAFNPASDNDATIADLLANDFSKLTTLNAGVKNLHIEGYINGNRPGLGIIFINTLNCFCEYIWATNVLTPVTVGNDSPGWQGACANTSVSNIYQVTCDPTSDGTDAGSFSWFDLMYVGSSVSTNVSRLYNNPNTPAALDYFIQTAGACKLTISECIFSGTNTIDTAIGLFSNANQDSFGISVTNNIFEKIRTAVLLVGTGTGGTKIDACTVSDNTFLDCTDTIVTVGPSTQKNNVSGNIYADGSITGPSGAGVNMDTDGSLLFMNRGTVCARINSDLSLLVGATSVPTNRPTGVNHLTVGGNLTCGGIGSHAGTSGAYQANNFNFEWTGSASLWVDSTNIGVIQTVSDYRIKKNVEVQTASAIERVMQLRPVKYEIADYENLFKSDGVQREGFVAHELQAIIPSAVEGKKDAPNQIQSLRLDALCSVLVKAIQEQQAQIETLKTEVAILKG